jgi:hypothetical protein
LAKQSGGKAGKGKNKTSSIFVYNEQSCIVKRFGFYINDIESRKAALKKARNFVQENK